MSSPDPSNPIDLRSQIGKVQFAWPAMNASGPVCTYDEEVFPLAESQTGAVVIKSATLEPRSGNPEPRLFWNPGNMTSMNSNGLCNLGYEGHAEQVARVREKHAVPVVGSIAGMKTEHFPIMAKRMGQVCSALEVNLSCPNLPGKPQVAFDTETAERVLGEVRQATDCDIWVKLPPYQDRVFVEEMAALLLKSEVQAAVCVNSPSGLDLDLETEQTRIHPNRGMGGAGGADIIRVTRWNIRQFFLAMREAVESGKIAVIGTGGITRGEDIYGHVLCGASAVQIGSAYGIEGPEIFARLKSELAAFMAKKGVTRLMDKLGALQVPEATS